MRNHYLQLLLILMLAFCVSCGNLGRTNKSPRQIENFDFDWKFSKGDFPEASQPDFDDSQWELLDVPHDWAILDTFSPDNPSGHPGGFASAGIGWYRKYFTLDRSDLSSNVSIEFDGVYMNSEVWINGHYLGIRLLDISVFTMT
jgi:beta-galactosidase